MEAESDPYLIIGFFTPDEWNNYKEVEGKNWVVKDLPFLKHQDFMVTGNWAVACYLLQLAGRQDMIGNCLQDRIKIDHLRNRMDLKETMLGMLCSKRLTSCQERKACMLQFYEKKIQPLMLQHEADCRPNDFYLGYITILDFVIYEMIYYLEKINPSDLGKYPKLVELRNRVGALPEIKAYEGSSRAVKDICPVAYFDKFKKEKIKAIKEMSSGSSTGSRSDKDMDLQ